MPQFLKVKTADEVLSILRHFEPLPAEVVGLESACHRVLAESIAAVEPIPHFPKALMDGFAVRARDTFGASESLPGLLEIAGEVAMGEAPSVVLKAGQAVAVPTGGMLPEGADAVCMIEYTYPMDEHTIEVTRPVAPGDHVLKAGEDIALQEKLFPAGWLLRPQDVGALAALGITSVSVHRRPRVAVLSTGDEIVPATTADLPPGKIRDINGFTLAAQVERAGGRVGWKETVPDDLGSLAAACRSALDSHDVLLLSGGSSVGVRDFTMRILDSFPEAELLVHGVAVRPGKPTILARLGGKMFWGLPGQPVSAMMIFEALVHPSLALLQGLSPESVSRRAAEKVRWGTLDSQVPSVHGRTDYVPVVLSPLGEEWRVAAVFGKSAMISTLARSDGYIIIPEHVEGLDRGARVAVYFFE